MQHSRPTNHGSRRSHRHPIRHSNNAIREALSYVASSGMPAQHKSILMDLIEYALDDDEQDVLPPAAVAESKQWQPHEVHVIATELEGKVAANWQHADELQMLLAQRLQRGPDEIKAKATELGFGAAVDYRIAKALVLSSS